ncbi:ADP-ribosyl-[dinitrogen reductase] hydrolase [Niveibacterium sp. SC-1]|uniref:ADP-ribosyl-[dinitrogen reductase] hydrolase n=1 Tax=Niveibacterium sp. SC-1 TaxID=3135646 RepID=UPI00311EA683
MAEGTRDEPGFTADGRPVPTLLDRALGAYLGLAIGDALGATVEFMMPREIATNIGLHDTLSGGGWLRLKPGQVTDDTTMSLALGDAIVGARGWDLREVAEHYARWLRAMPVDCGHTCRRGIRRYLSDGSLQGAFHDGDAGNGAAMRNLPVVLAFHRDTELLERYSLEQGRITHHHPLSDQANLTLARMTACLLKGEPASVALQLAQDLVRREPRFAFEHYRGPATGYVVDTLRTVLFHFFDARDFEQTLIAVVNRGEDADTTGAIAGMLAGACYGQQALPRRWVRKLDPIIRHRIEVQVRQLLSLPTAMRSIRPGP